MSDERDRTYDAAETTRCYDLAARAYAEQFKDELLGKPFDRWILDRFAATVAASVVASGAGRVVYDVGSGSGHVAAYLARDPRLEVRGLDLARGMVEVAAGLYPEVAFEQGDFLQLPWPDASVAGITAFYAIVHLSLEDVGRALDEFLRVLVPEGILLFSFHVGRERVTIDGFLEVAEARASWNFFELDEILELVAARSGWRVEDAIVRRPYAGVEHASQRAYVILRKQAAPS